MSAPDFQLSRNAYGKLLYAAQDGDPAQEAVPVRAFPIADPANGIALMSIDGHELAWIDRLADLPAPARALVEEELAGREFMPEIRRLRGVSGFAAPSTWRVETDRGEASFVLKGEEDIRRLSANTLLVADSHGIQFLIRDLSALDAGSRRLLDRFL